MMPQTKEVSIEQLNSKLISEWNNVNAVKGQADTMFTEAIIGYRNILIQLMTPIIEQNQLYKQENEKLHAELDKVYQAHPEWKNGKKVTPKAK
jgi:hypothetical protein